MNSPEFLQKQFNLINGTLHIVVEPLTDEQWLGRPVAGGNRAAFTALHLVRALDAHLHTVYRGVPEVASQEPWASHPAIGRPGVGIGLTLEEADAVAVGVSKEDLLAYADAVRASGHAWLKQLDQAELEREPDFKGNAERGPAIYREPPYLENWPVGPPLNSRPEKPLWLLLTTIVMHSCQHLGEIEIAAQAVERAAEAPDRRATSLSMM